MKNQKSKIECYDIGGTKIRAAIIEGQNNHFTILSLKERKSIKGNFSKLIDELNQMSKELKKDNLKPEVISIGFPGPVYKGMLMNAPPLHITEKIDLKKGLEKKLGPTKIIFGNDVEFAAKAELVYGEGRHSKHFYLLTLSTGIGAGVIIDKKILQNSYREFGHDILEKNKDISNKCSCGKQGCWVAMSSGYGINETIKKENLGNINKFFNLISKKETKAINILEKIKEYNAQGIGNMLNEQAVDKIIIMGGLGLNQFHNIIPSKKQIANYTRNPIPEIKPTILGENIGIVGAYLNGTDYLNQLK